MKYVLLSYNINVINEMLKELEGKQFKWEILLKEPKESQGMTTISGKTDRDHKLVQVALLLFCVNLISGRLMHGADGFQY